MSNLSPVRRVAIGADHAGYRQIDKIVKKLTEWGYDVIDFGTHSGESTDYPDYAERVAKAVAKGGADRGVLICGSGIGMAIAANKVRGVRAAVVWSPTTARLASEHNWANVLCLSSRFATLAELTRLTKIWLKTPWQQGGRHERRVKKIRKLDLKR